jgi:ankyrin repeat protein
MTSKGGDPNRTRQDGHTPLSVAAMTNDLPVVQELVARGGDPKMRFNPADQVADPVEAKTEKRENQTILHIAGISGSEWVVEYLAKAGAPLTATNSKGETPLAIADAQERFRDAHDREGPLGVGIGSEVVRETQTSDAFKRAMGQTRVASQGSPSRAQ